MNNIIFRPAYRKSNEDLGRIFGNVIHSPLHDIMLEPRVRTARVLSNISENETHFSIDLAVPGFGKENITIDAEADVLTIKGKKEGKEDVKYYMREFHLNEFSRVFKMPEGVQTDKIEASFEQGILNISIPKKEKKPALQIAVK